MLSAFLFLTFGSLSVSAQYYMNVFQNDGQKFHFVVANIDSVSFTDQTGLTDNEEENKYEFVDLGLSVNWATRNVGASSFEKYGDYFAWGETSVKNSYSWSNYKFCHGTDVTQTKYCTNGNFGYNGVTDNKSILDLDDDVAQVNWGDSWRMPTSSEFLELQTYCTWTWTTLNGVKGYKIAGNKEGYTDRFIFLPAAGYCNGTITVNSGSIGGYWSSSVVSSNPSKAWMLAFGGKRSDDSYHDVDMQNRLCGLSVRPVCPSSTWRGITSISLDESKLTVTEGNSCVLTAYLKSGETDYNFFSDYYNQITWSTSNPSVATVDERGMVTTLSIGSTIITATFNSFKADCVINVVSIYAPTGSEQSYGYVDLGLSVKWATVNVGANEKEDYGDYFSWGTDVNSTYNYKYYYSNSRNRLTKYCTVSEYGNNGFTDSKVTLEPEDDVAHLKWGGTWRMPTNAELDELFNKDNCTWTWTTINDVNGFCVTSKKEGYERRSIFIPAAGYTQGNTEFYKGTKCYYWSSCLYTSNPSYAYCFKLNSNGYIDGSYSFRDFGLVVRPVCLFKADDISEIELNKTVLNLSLCGEEKLSVIGKKTENENVQVDVNRWTSSNETVAVVKNGLVTAVGEGTCVITVYLGSFKDTCVVTVKDLNNVEYDYVDLGLSVLWATFNVGAFSPEMHGNYYAWGETEPKSDYTWSNYKYCNGSSSTMTKYCNKSSYGDNGFIDNKTKLDSEDDVAHVLWGGSWRMPTRAEFRELKDSCTWTWTTQNGVNGCRVTSNKPGYTDRSIFFPVTGSRIDAILNDAESRGYYWSSSLENDKPGWASDLYCYNGGSKNSSSRFVGLSVRPVCPSETWEGFTSMEIDKNNLSMAITESFKHNVISLMKNDLDYSYFISDISDQVIWTSSNESVAMVGVDGTVTALSYGETSICAQYNDLKDSCIITVSDIYSASGTEQKIGYVDLGLSVKWATVNVGTFSIGENGYYIAWGEADTKSTYNWSTYKYCKGSYTKLTKYCNNSSYGNNGFTDSKTTLDMVDDVAYQKWGGRWRMPTIDEFRELYNNCFCTWTTLNGVNGYKLISKKPGYTNRAIFLPAAGRRSDTDLNDSGSQGYYWSSSLYTSLTEGAWGFGFFPSGSIFNCQSRVYGMSVRAVCQ